MIACDTVVVGAGNVGIAAAYYLVTRHAAGPVVLVDAAEPMSLTSAQSGENYRNWWPHPVMTAFTDHSIDLLEQIADASGDRIHMTRRGYALATRQARPDALIADLQRGYGDGAGARLRLQDRPGTLGPGAYRPAIGSAWRGAPDGVDILTDQALIRAHFPSFAPDIATVIHIRRAGDISGQQLGQFMLEAIKARGGRVLRGRVAGIAAAGGFTVDVAGQPPIRAGRLVNAAGPFVGAVAAMLGETLPVTNVAQQKIAFEDRATAIPRAMPFSIDLDEQVLDWTPDERAELAADPATAALTRPMPGGMHCRPDGGDGGRWVKLGWATNRSPGDPDGLALDPHFPDLVLRAASRLNPALRTYLGRLPRNARHYGGHYTMTPENWPLLGPMATPGAFVAGALSGFGTMAACAAGALVAAWAADAPRPAYAAALSPSRYADPALMASLQGIGQGVL